MEQIGGGAGDATRAAVLASLSRAPASRATIARELGLSPATVTQVTKRLIQQGLLEPLSFAPSDGGRPGQLLGLVGGAGHAVGVKLAADHLVLADVRLDGQVIATQTDGFDAVAPDAVTRLVTGVQSFLDGGSGRLLGVGVGVPGVVALPDVGNVDTPVLGWSNMPLGRYLRRALGVPVLIENDVKALAVAERLYGKARDRSSFVLITVGRGVGFACFVKGVLERGAHGGAGELGHVIITPNGAACACGSRGCLESYVGAEGLVSEARSNGVLRADEDLGRLFELAGAGRAEAREVYSRAAQRLARVVAPAIAALDPEVVLIAGEGTSSWPYWDAAFRRGLLKRLPTSMRDMPVEVDEWDELSWARGAAAIVLATPFDQHAFAGQQREGVLARLHGEDSDEVVQLVQPGS